MQEFESPTKLTPWLFFQLLNATPAENVHPSTVMIAAGACHGLIYGPVGGRVSDLEEAFTELWSRDQPYKCGCGLLTLMHTLFTETMHHPLRRIDLDHLAELMVAALNDQGLRIRGDGKGLRIVSSRTFRHRHGVRINVPLRRPPDAA
ncbi:hypothetical protein [Microvirga aerophila]|uniref:Uncharacterized protein n=1 Tax=Microvirga aerophila TaxID=670291 RepID=A0A512BSU4_9HYPH|nr:hypothetical protein [Microvirga aerophila]GEO15066.1 hypothetical protein MAE02_27620 [Microvirga aerophila]